jgi:hypothetical protein
MALRAPALALVALLATACSTFVPGVRGERSADDESSARSLTAIVSELQLHFRDDTYRLQRPSGEGGQNLFAVAQWRLERLQRARALEPERWRNVDYVIEFARARALERQRRYSEARTAYTRVAGTGNALAAAADEAAGVMASFQAQSGPGDAPLVTPDDELQLFDARVKAWEQLALLHRGDPWASLAREEAESWEMLRVEWFARHASAEEAVAAARRLVERHRESKLRARHLIRLGDLCAEASRREYLAYRAGVRSFDAALYQHWLDRAFAAYELAGEARRREHRTEAHKKLEALLAYHNGVRAHVP